MTVEPECTCPTVWHDARCPLSVMRHFPGPKVLESFPIRLAPRRGEGRRMTADLSAIVQTNLAEALDDWANLSERRVAWWLDRGGLPAFLVTSIVGYLREAKTDDH